MGATTTAAAAPFAVPNVGAIAGAGRCPAAYRYSLVAYAPSDHAAAADAAGRFASDKVTVLGSPTLAQNANAAEPPEPLVLDYVVIVTDQVNMFPVVTTEDSAPAASSGARGRDGQRKGGPAPAPAPVPPAPIETVLAAACARYVLTNHAKWRADRGTNV